MTEPRHDDAVDVLVQQHARIREMFTDVTRASGEDKQKRFDELRAMLAVHETAEEEVLRPVTRISLPNGGEVADARLAEENDAKKVLSDLERMGTTDPGFDTTFAQFQKDVLAHADAEERDEFPGLRQSRGEVQLVAVGKAIRAAEALAPTHPHPSAKNTTINLVAGPFVALVDRVRDVIKTASS